uniref:S-RNase n=1 Tax=Ziziphus jujuba TaxID=326968 RepID=A0A386N6R9_ZIZJJ|nr:S-RNase [Ziziphus jujuba]
MEIILILIILVASSSSCQAMFTDQVGAKQKIDKFVVLFAPNYCSTGTQTCRSNLPDYFTIHGIWPNELSPPIPRTFNLSLLKDQLLDDLLAQWPGLKNSSDANEEFWKHEWEKHGRYFSGTQVEYFQKGIDLLRTQEIQNALSELLINGKKYVTVDILKRLKQITKSNPAFSCKDSKQGTTKLLVEVTFCLDPDLTTHKDCPAKQSCGTEFYVDTSTPSPSPSPSRYVITEKAVASF